jgi:hypothetical protein
VDEQIHCTRCRRNQVEDILHCLWSCPRSGRVWSWVRSLLQATSGAPHLNLDLQFHHIFLAEPLDEANGVPERMWKTVRGAVCWILWTSRCNHYMAGEKSSSTSDINKVWGRISRYIQKHWTEKLAKTHQGKITMAEAKEEMILDYGVNTQIWCIQDCRLMLPTRPPSSVR